MCGCRAEAAHTADGVWWWPWVAAGKGRVLRPPCWRTAGYPFYASSAFHVPRVVCSVLTISFLHQIEIGF